MIGRGPYDKKALFMISVSRSGTRLGISAHGNLAEEPRLEASSLFEVIDLGHGLPFAGEDKFGVTASQIDDLFFTLSGIRREQPGSYIAPQRIVIHTTQRLSATMYPCGSQSLLFWRGADMRRVGMVRLIPAIRMLQD
jgi:hypothetical protein